MDGNEPRREVSRREVLRKGAAVSGALVAGGVAAGGTAVAHEGGVALVSNLTFGGVDASELVFTIDAAPGDCPNCVTKALTPSCPGAAKEYEAYRIVLRDPDTLAPIAPPRRRRLWVDVGRDLTVDDDPTNPGAVHEFHNVFECSTPEESSIDARANFKKVTPGRGPPPGPP